MKTFPLEPGWRAMLKDLGISASNVLRRARLPDDLLARAQAALSTDEYFRFWSALEAESGSPRFVLKLLDALTSEMLSPPLLAALCSADLREAAQRLARYKRLIAPMSLDIRATRSALRLAPRWLDDEAQQRPPTCLVVAELGFFVRLAAMGTRETIRAIDVTMPDPPASPAAYERFFGAPVRRSPSVSITFDAADADKPFLTANEVMWTLLERDLGARMVDLTDDHALTDRVRALLLEALPGGRCALDEVASRLAMSSRSLQRKLGDEGTSFKNLLHETREAMARRYVADPRLSYAEIAFLLGFEDPNSFFRAFNAWTGTTPEAMRREGVSAGVQGRG